MKCKICNEDLINIFEAKIINKYNINYYHCINCGFMQTEDPYWLNEAYKDAINIEDTGILVRNIGISKNLAIILYYLFPKQSKILDFAGGWGILVRLMRDIGFDFYWSDLYADNLFAKGFENKQANTYSAITSFESFEHFVEPLSEIEKMLAVSKNIIFTTALLPKIIPLPTEWWYYGLSHGQHISFYSENTLKYIAKKYDLQFYKILGFYMFTDRIFWYHFIFRFLGYRYIRMLLTHFMKSKSKTVDDMNSIIKRKESIL